MDMKEEMMNDAIDDVIGDEEDDEERLVRLKLFFWCHFFYYLYSQTCLGRCGSFMVSVLISASSSSSYPLFKHDRV